MSDIFENPDKIHEHLVPELEQTTLSGDNGTTENLDPVGSYDVVFERSGLRYGLEEPQSAEYFEVEDALGVERIGYNPDENRFGFEYSDNGNGRRREEYWLVEDDEVEEAVGIVGNPFNENDVLDILYSPEKDSLWRSNRMNREATGDIKNSSFGKKYDLMEQAVETTERHLAAQKSNFRFGPIYLEDIDDLGRVSQLGPESNTVQDINDDINLGGSYEVNGNPATRVGPLFYKECSSDMKPLVKIGVGDYRGFFIEGWRLGKEFENDKIYGIRAFHHNDQDDLNDTITEDNQYVDSGFEWARQVLENEDRPIIN